MATLLKGSEVAKEIRAELKVQVDNIKLTNPSFTPGLAIVQVGDRKDSNVYIRMKIRAAAEIGMMAEHAKLDASKTQEELLDALQELNNRQDIHGIILQLPLESDHDIDEDLCTNKIDPAKDVDGLTDVNAGKLARGNMSGSHVPCTPRGCLELIKRSGIELKGAKAVVVGRSKIVGSPMHDLLLWNHCTVSVCHSRTKDLASEVKTGDIVVVAAGRRDLVTGDMVKEGAVVIDCGINPIPDETKKSGQRLVGDVEFESVQKVASYLTPVPGGVGPMTVAMLMQNTFDCAKALTKDAHWQLKEVSLDTQTPVPSDTLMGL